jgi:hypothetical protein
MIILPVAAQYRRPASPRRGQPLATVEDRWALDQCGTSKADSSVPPDNRRTGQEHPISSANVTSRQQALQRRARQALAGGVSSNVRLLGPQLIADVAEGAPRMGRVEVAGPELADARDMARTWRSATGQRALLLPVPLPGQLGRALRRGVLISQRPDVTGTIRFADWLVSPVRVSQ